MNGSCGAAGSLRRKYVPLSLIRKKYVPCALSGLPAVRPVMVRFGLDMMGLPSRGSSKGRSGIVRPVEPVTAMSSASSSSLSGCGSCFEL
ncbi:hypothetical protein ACIRLA_41835 [Streptomyces sp. NPDC102364]|uniref:hypothetical protein n=1 Tax=Streptomyces sp. NPDC102364 TaxID=3366161 RepID=UPI003813A7C3